MVHPKYLIVLGGPTASGKTGLSIRLAQQFCCPILSCDSRQLYREMNIGTAKPTAAALVAATHYFINTLSIIDSYSVGDYEREAIALLEDIYTKQDVAILVGGTGLYIRAVCEGLDPFPEVSDAIRNDLQVTYRELGIVPLQEELRAKDPTYAAQVDMQNPHRLLRALGVIRASGQPFSAFRSQQKASRFFTPIYVCLQWERATLYERINQRVDEMMAAGLLEEARALYPFRENNALQTVGYQELFDFFDKKCALEEAVSLIKRNSRRYAKRQMTWFRRDKHWTYFHPSEIDAISAFVLTKMGRR